MPHKKYDFTVFSNFFFGGGGLKMFDFKGSGHLNRRDPYFHTLLASYMIIINRLSVIETY